MKKNILAAIIAISFFGVACNHSTNQAEAENHSEMNHDMHSDENSDMHSETESIIGDVAGD